MSHYTRHYAGLSREAADEAAIKDIREYLGDVAFADLVENVTQGDFSFKSVNMALGMAGVRDYPVHAFGRHYMLDAYREWMHSSVGGAPRMTDEQGFPLEGR